MTVMFEAGLLPFVGASILLALSPGPDNLFVLSQAIVHGAQKGLLITLGLSTGLIIHTFLIALGVGSLIQSSAIISLAISLFGFAYLLYIAIQTWREADQVVEKKGTKSLSALTDLEAYRRGIVMNVTNPKVSLFFIAYLPQFVSSHQDTSPILQFIQLGAIFAIVTIVIFGLIAFMSEFFRKLFLSSRMRLVALHRVSACVLAVLACYLLLSNLIA